MGRTLENVMDSLSPQAQKRVEDGAAALLKEYDSLMEFRKAAGLTQVELAERMQITQVNVSRLERRDDMHLSTLRRYVEALGGELEINVKLPAASTKESGYLARLTL